MSTRFNPEKPPRIGNRMRWFLGHDRVEFSEETITACDAAAEAYEDALIRWGWRSARRRERIYRKNPPTPVVIPSPLRSWVDDPKHWVRRNNAHG